MNKKFTILLDNGHGKETPGKRSPLWPDGTQLFEYEFNRDIVNRLIPMFERSGLNVVKLVPELNDVSLKERVTRANNFYKKDKNCILLSIHANAGGGTGWEAFTTKGVTKSDTIAEYLYKEAESMGFKVRKDMTDGDRDKEENFYIIKNSNMPAVLTENFFMDTRTDCNFIMSDAGREKIALMHYNAIMKYLKDFKLFEPVIIADSFHVEADHKCNMV